jgi:hypothetical protein
MTVDWYGKFANWFGDIEGVLTAHPVVKGDHVVQPAGVVSVSVPLADGHEATAGALDAFVLESKASALDSSMMETDAEVAQPKKAMKAMSAAKGASNGGSHNGAKKRKADRISADE